MTKYKIQELIRWSLALIVVLFGGGFFMAIAFFSGSSIDDIDPQLHGGKPSFVIFQVIIEFFVKHGFGGIVYFILSCFSLVGSYFLIQNIFADVIEREYKLVYKISGVTISFIIVLLISLIFKEFVS